LAANSYRPTSLERARDELFSHIQRCGVLEAELDQREEWLADTVGYLAERYPDLSKPELSELHEIGQRYCMPPIKHGNSNARDRASEEGADDHEGERDEVNAA
jgi:hypothetical protein